MSESGSQPEWDEVLRAVQALADRIARIEQHLQLPQHAAIPPSAAAATEPARTAFAEGANAVPIAGRCLLGLAGAYLLRAVTESQMLPSKPGVFAAILYAVAWLVWAARVAAGRRAETVLYSLTSALVLGPLLWESTLRFHAISTWTAASVLLVFTVFGLMISWHKSLLVVATIATLTGVLTAVALLIGSHDVGPFMLLLLAIAAAVEISACLEHWLSERWLTATAADLAVLLATYLVTNERGFPETYLPISHFTLLAAQLGLLTIYLGSTMVRTLLRGFSFTGFETVQLALAFSVGLGGGLRLRGDPHIGLTMDAVFLICAVACYAAAFAQRGRNFLTYAWVGCLLVLAGTSIALPPGAAAAVWCVLAISELGARSVALRWQGCFYLLCGVATSGGLADAKDFILGGADSTAALWPALGAAAAAFACYTLATRGVLASRMPGGDSGGYCVLACGRSQRSSIDARISRAFRSVGSACLLRHTPHGCAGRRRGFPGVGGSPLEAPGTFSRCLSGDGAWRLPAVARGLAAGWQGPLDFLLARLRSSPDALAAVDAVAARGHERVGRAGG